MKLLIDSFWRAAAYCLHPKVIALSLLPLAIGVALSLGLGWLYWEPSVAFVRHLLDSVAPVDLAISWLEGFVGPSIRGILAPLLVVLTAAPVIVVLSVLLVAVLMTPAIVQLVVNRRFPDLEQKKGAGLFVSALWSLGCTLLALLLMIISLPLWLIPPLVLVLPPLIWGWLTYKVMSFDTLAVHASKEERRAVIAEHRLPLLGIGVVTGYLGAAPSLIWAASVVTVIFAPFVIAVAVWLYTLVFAFSALWFAHYLLAALVAVREAAAANSLKLEAADRAGRTGPAAGLAAPATAVPTAGGSVVVTAPVGSASGLAGGTTAGAPATGGHGQVVDVSSRPVAAGPDTAAGADLPFGRTAP